MTTLTTTRLERPHFIALSNLLFKSYYVYTHLDWQDVHDWIGTEDAIFRLAWHGNRLAGVLAVSAPIDGHAWLRLIALEDDTAARDIVLALWQAMIPELEQRGIHHIAALLSLPWVEHLLVAMGFRYEEQIITLRRATRHVPWRRSSPFVIRHMEAQDIPHIEDVDHRAFAPLWQMSRTELWQARRIAALATVAEIDGTIAGYQISTDYRDSAHLARLAVHPQHQAAGVGSTLVNDLLHRFHKRSIYTITVNTQISNRRSQRLYAGFGFQRNGYDLPVWSITL